MNLDEIKTYFEKQYQELKDSSSTYGELEEKIHSIGKEIKQSKWTSADSYITYLYEFEYKYMMDRFESDMKAVSIAKPKAKTVEGHVDEVIRNICNGLETEKINNPFQLQKIEALASLIEARAKY